MWKKGMDDKELAAFRRPLVGKDCGVALRPNLKPDDQFCIAFLGFLQICINPLLQTNKDQNART